MPHHASWWIRPWMRGGDNNLILDFYLIVFISFTVETLLMEDVFGVRHVSGVGVVLHYSYLIFNCIFCLSEFEFGGRLFGKEVCDAIVAKRLVGKRKTDNKAKEVLFLWVELGAVDAFMVIFFLYMYLIPLSLNVSHEFIHLLCFHMIELND